MKKEGVCVQVVEDSHHFDEDQDPHVDPHHKVKSRIPIAIKVTSCIRIRICSEVKRGVRIRIRNSACAYSLHYKKVYVGVNDLLLYLNIPPSFWAVF
jgi:hypothetical protein